MSLTAQEEQRVREILALSAQLIDLGDKATEIDAALGYGDTRVIDLPVASALNANDVMYLAQQNADSKASIMQLAQFTFDTLVQSQITPFLAGKANVNSATLTGDPRSVTPPQFDNDTSIATTAFVQRALGNSAGSLVFAAGGTQTLTAADAGKVIVLGGTTPGTIVLPLTGSMAEGSGFLIKSESTATWNITSAASDGLAIRYNRINSSILQILVDEDFVFKKVGSLWRTSGTGILRNSAIFGNVKLPNGYQILPGGLIIQWGSVQGTTEELVTPLPIAFPSTILGWIGSPHDQEGGPLTGTFYATGATNTRTTAGGVIRGWSGGTWSMGYVSIGY